MKALIPLFVLIFAATGQAEDICLIKWKSESNKIKYKKGLNLTRKEKIEKKLMFQRYSENLVVYSKSKEGHHVLTGRNINKDRVSWILKKLNFKSKEYESRAREFLSGTGFRYSTKSVRKKMEDYKKIDCNKYEEGTYL